MSLDSGQNGLDLRQMAFAKKSFALFFDLRGRIGLAGPPIIHSSQFVFFGEYLKIEFSASVKADKMNEVEMKPSGRDLRRVFWSGLIVAAAIICFQNCRDGVQQANDDLKSKGNGEGYSGKITYANFAEAPCDDGNPARSMFQESSGGYTLVRDECAQIAPREIGDSEVDHLEQTDSFAVYDAKLYGRTNLGPGPVEGPRDPGDVFRLRIVLCRSSQEISGQRVVRDALLQIGAGASLRISRGHYAANGSALDVAVRVADARLTSSSPETYEAQLSAPESARLALGLQSAGSLSYWLDAGFGEAGSWPMTCFTF